MFRQMDGILFNASFHQYQDTQTHTHAHPSTHTYLLPCVGLRCLLYQFLFNTFPFLFFKIFFFSFFSCLNFVLPKKHKKAKKDTKKKKKTKRTNCRFYFSVCVCCVFFLFILCFFLVFVLSKALHTYTDTRAPEYSFASKQVSMHERSRSFVGNKTQHSSEFVQLIFFLSASLSPLS